MKVSVVIPAFQAASTLGHSVAALRGQSEPDWEAIIVDDGSTDGTGRVADDLAAQDSRIRVIHQENRGEATARNVGIAAATGTWLLFLDADDWIAPNHLHRMLAALAEDPTLDAVHCGWVRVAADGTHVDEGYRPPAGDLFEIWARRSAFPVHACLVRRELVDRLGGFDPSLRRSTDWDLWQRIARTGARFGAVPETLAFYRMNPTAVTHNAEMVLEDGLTVLARGHGPDPRVPDAAPQHRNGLHPEGIPRQAFYLLSWCAGMLLGQDADPSPLLRHLDGMALHPESVARCLFDAAPLPSCAPPSDWERLWPLVREPAARFLDALETQAGAPGLAARAHAALQRLATEHSPSWQPVLAGAQEREAALEQSLREAGAQADANARAIAELRAQLSRETERANGEITALRAATEGLQHLLHELESRLQEAARSHVASMAEHRREAEALATRLEARALAAEAAGEAARRAHSAAMAAQRREAEELAMRLESRALAVERSAEEARLAHESALAVERRRVAERTRERDVAERARAVLDQSTEVRLGRLLLDRLRLRRPLLFAHGVLARIGQRATLLRLAAGRALHGQRVMATICSEFPIYSQTFVHQELEQIATAGHTVRIAYSTSGGRKALGGRFDGLWRGRTRLVQHRPIHRRHLLRYERTEPARVGSLLERLADASGIPMDSLRDHDNVLEAFTFARMVEAWRPEYLHSYFFYDRSLMALIAAELHGIPRGVTCYADHMLADYELKVVPLHLELASLVVATSRRIKQELLALAPTTDPERILVKPNGVATERFPVLQRHEPAADQPHRVVTVARIEPKKGLITLVDAIGLLRARGLAVEAHIVGAADEWNPASREAKARLDERIDELDLWGAVHLEGRRDHAGVLRFLQGAHLFVAPFVETASGDKDGIPTALLEGMATGLPAVATDAGSIPEVVSHGEDGLIVPQQDPEAMADAIAALLTDPTRRMRFGARAASTVRSRFDATACEAQLHERIAHVIRERR